MLLTVFTHNASWQGNSLWELQRFSYLKYQLFTSQCTVNSLKVHFSLKFVPISPSREYQLNIVQEELKTKSHSVSQTTMNDFSNRMWTVCHCNIQPAHVGVTETLWSSWQWRRPTCRTPASAHCSGTSGWTAAWTRSCRRRRRWPRCAASAHSHRSSAAAHTSGKKDIRSARRSPFISLSVCVVQYGF